MHYSVCCSGLGLLHGNTPVSVCLGQGPSFGPQRSQSDLMYLDSKPDWCVVLLVAFPYYAPQRLCVTPLVALPHFSFSKWFIFLLSALTHSTFLGWCVTSVSNSSTLYSHWVMRCLVGSSSNLCVSWQYHAPVMPSQWRQLCAFPGWCVAPCGSSSALFLPWVIHCPIDSFSFHVFPMWCLASLTALPSSVFPSR